MMSLTRLFGDLMAKINTKLFKEATAICKALDITINFGYAGEGSTAWTKPRRIEIDLLDVKNINNFWSIVFHEIAHIYCWDNDIYYTYHADNLPKKEMAKYIRKMGLKVERFVDKLGEELMKEYGFNMRYVRAYRSKEDIKWYKDWIDKEYPL